LPLSAGTRLGSYEILSALGAGGMGEVYRARDTRLGRDVAIKALPLHMAHDPDARARFEREAHAVAALNHPHIVTIFSTEEADGVRFLTMELVEGRTLDQMIPRGGVSLAQFFDIAIALADALAAAHRKHLTHRDLKPSNVMVSDDGRVKVLDFGLARSAEPERLDESETVVPLTKAGTIVGTIPYMSPEQIEGAPLDPRSDIFSLGIVLYEMAAGDRPFGGASSPTLMAAILKDRPTPVSERRSDFPAGVSQLIDRCLEKQPGDRIQSATEILAEVRAQRRAWESGAERAVTRATDAGRSIAVLPFTDLSATKDQDWFCDGIAEEILNALAPLQGLRVAARTSAFSFKGKTDDLRMIGAKLNVTTVLAGSLRRAGDRLRITVQLSDVASGFQLWSEQYDRELKDIFDVQEEIAKAIAERLRVTLAGGKDARLVEQGTTNVEAYQLYLRGYALLGRRGASIPEALDLFRKAVEIDPGYSHAWSGIADACTGLGITGSVSNTGGKSQAMAAATRSIEIDPTSAAGHTALACATLLFDNNRAMAKEEFERALELRPSYALGRSWYATFFLQWTCGELEQGIVEVRRALDSDPLSAYIMMLLACCLCTAGRLNEAIETARRAVRQDPESFITRWVLGVSLGTAGQFDEAVSTLETASAISGRHSRALASLALVFGQSGKRPEASALHGELVDRASRAYVPLTYLALTAEASGQHEEAMSLARRAWDARDPTFILHARHFPEFRSLRSDPRFVAILREMNRPTSGEASIAVLPFANMSADKENEYFGDGLAEEILNVLAQVPGLKVAGRTSSFFFRGKDVEFEEIGRRLNVEHILEGSVRKAGNRIRVTAQLIKVADGFHLWSDRYDRELTDIFAIQDEITHSIAAALRIRLSRETTMARRHVPNLRAYDAYLKARDHLYKPTPESLELFKERIDHAIELDPEFGLARSISGGYYTMQSAMGIKPAREVIPLAKAAEHEALRLDPSLPEAHALLAVCNGTYDYDWNEAQRHWRLAMAREPVSHDIRLWYGNHYLLPIGRPLEAVEMIAKSLDGDPLNPLGRHHFAVALRHAGRLEDAEVELRKVLEIDENFPLALSTLGAVCAQQGRFEEALALTERAHAAMPWANVVIGQLAALMVRGGSTSGAETLLRQLGPGDTYGAPTGLAVFHALCGDFDQSVDWAERAIAERYPPLVAILRPLLQSSSRWPALAKLMNLPL